MQHFTKAFKEKKVLIIGDLMIDRYLTGKVSRISPEAPVPVVLLDKKENRLGGAANVALNIAGLEATAVLCGIVGEDENADLLVSLMDEAGLIKDGILKSKARRTTVKTRVLAANQQLLRVDTEDSNTLSSFEQTQLSNLLDALFEQHRFDAVILQDYNKGVLHPDIISKVIAQTKSNQLPVAVDPKEANFYAFKDVYLFKPNLKEINAMVPFEVPAEIGALDRADSYLRSKLQHQISFITLSEHGIYINDGQHSSIYPAQQQGIVDVCGAGDTVIALAGLSLAVASKPEEMAKICNIAGGIVCQKAGVVPIRLEELAQQL